MFEQGDLKYVILRLLAEKPRHGYEIIKELEDRFSGAYAPSAGTVYPTLTLLEDLGYGTGDFQL
jgi:DNA-binding PadR family transcriptional regulator